MLAVKILSDLAAICSAPILDLGLWPIPDRQLSTHYRYSADIQGSNFSPHAYQTWPRMHASRHHGPSVIIRTVAMPDCRSNQNHERSNTSPKNQPHQGR